MKEADVGCLGNEDVRDYLSGSAPPERRALWERHVQTCARCSSRVEAVRAEGRAVVEGAVTTPLEKDESLSAMMEALDAAGSTDAGEAAPLPPPDAIPGYRILRELHRGGQGVVYQALQESARRKVALKVLLEGPFAGTDSRRRFEREIALVGSLRHPNIVPIFDSGAAEGRYYYAMEYVRGESLSEYVERKRLGVDETLRLFQKVCEAVDYAHQKGVIHRDLKPSNILVDAGGKPHVLDFGLAKIGGPEVADTRDLLISVTGQVMGTLPYMSPEQAAGRPDQVDLRSDVYALAVVLYEILTGQYPYDVTGQVADVLRNIQETAPKRPRTVRRQVNDEVETIVLKGLSKEKERRYVTAGALAEDIGRVLRGEPIEAKRDSALYLLRKTLQRYKLPAGVAAVFFVMALSAAIGLSVLSTQAIRERDKAQRLEREAVETATVLKKTVRDLYFGQIAAAQGAFEARDARRFRTFLDRCPPELRSWEWRYLEYHRLFLDRDGVVLYTHENVITAEAVSRDGRWVATADREGTIKIWNLPAGKLECTLPGHARRVQALAFSPDGKLLVSGSDDGFLKIWEVPRGREVKAMRCDRGAHTVAFSRDGSRLASGHGVWDSATWETLPVDLPNRGPVSKIRFAADGDQLIAGEAGGVLRLWNLEQKQDRVIGDHGRSVASLDVSPDGSRLVSADWEGTIKLWDLRRPSDGPIRELAGHTSSVWSVAYSSDGKLIASASRDRTVRVWDAVTGTALRCHWGHEDAVMRVRFLPGEFRLVSASGRTVRLLQLREEDEWALQPVQLEGISALAISPDSRWVVAATEPGTTVWDLETRVARATLAGGAGVAFSPEGGRLICGRSDGAVLFHDTQAWEVRSSLDVGMKIECLALSPDGRVLAVGGQGLSGDGTTLVGFWKETDAGTWSSMATARLESMSRIESVVFSPDGTYAVLGGGGKVVVMEASGRPKAIILSGHSGRVHGVAVSPDGRRIASAGTDDVRVWDTASHRELYRPLSAPISDAVTFSPDGTRILAVWADGTIRVWETETGEPALILRHGSVRLSALAMNERFLVSGDISGAVRVWPAVETNTDLPSAR